MLGVVLCGGQSTRMGADKGLLLSHGKTWAQIAKEKFNLLQIPVMLSVNSVQKETYLSYVFEEQLIVDQASLGIRGPLLALLSAHLANPDQDLLVLACDLLLMDPALLKQLIETHRQTKHADAFLYLNHGEQEPLCGIYTAKALGNILAVFRSKCLAKHSMKFMLSQLNVLEIPLPEEYSSSFRNFNSQAELNDL